MVVHNKFQVYKNKPKNCGRSISIYLSQQKWVQSLNYFKTKRNNTLIRSLLVFLLQGLNRLILNCRFILQIFTLDEVVENFLNEGWWLDLKLEERQDLLLVALQRLGWFECARVLNLVEKSQFVERIKSPFYIGGDLYL